MFALIAVSCEDYLDEELGTSIDSGYIFNTEAGLQSGVVSLYKFERDRYDNSNQDFLAAVTMASRGDLTFSRSGYTGNMGRYERGVSPDDLGTRWMSGVIWANYYKISNNATAIINAAETLEGLNEDSKNQIIAEAKFFRAHSYFYLYRMFKNIFVTTETVTLDNAFDVVESPSSKEEIL